MIESFLSGLIAAFTPCIIVLFPIFFYRFHNNISTKEIIELSLGFLSVFIIMGLFLNELFSSSVQNGLRLGLGIFFIVLGILLYMERLNPLNIPFFKNLYLFGGSFALTLSFNPCTLPYLSIIISNKINVLLNVLFFGIGLLIPALIFAFFGNKLLSLTKNIQRFMGKIQRAMSFLLVITGAYMALTIEEYGRKDLYASILILFMIFFVVLRVFFIVRSKRDLLKLKNILLILALLGIGVSIFIQCHHYTEPKSNISKFEELVLGN